MLRNYDDPSQDPVFSEVTNLDLGDVVPSISGPKRPHDRVSVTEAQKDFKSCLTNKVSTQIFIYLFSIRCIALSFNAILIKIHMQEVLKL